MDYITIKSSLGRFFALTLCLGLFSAQTITAIEYQIPQKYLNDARTEAVEARKQLENDQEWKQREENRFKTRLYGYFGVPTLTGALVAAANCYSGNYIDAVASVAIGTGIGAGFSFLDYRNKKKTNEVELDLETIRVLSANSAESKVDKLNKARLMISDTIKKTYCRPSHFLKGTEEYTSFKRISKGFFGDKDDKYENASVSKDVWEYGISPADKYIADLAFIIAETASDVTWTSDFREKVSSNLLWRNEINLSRFAKRSMTTL